MTTNPLTLYKLIILYLLHKMDSPLTNSQLCEFMLNEEYTTYFTLQQVISELLEENFIADEHIQNTSFYTITETGRETLEFFQSNISDAIIQDIDKYLEKYAYDLKNENKVTAEYYKQNTDEYMVHGTIKDGKNILAEIRMTIEDEEMAIKMCDNFKKHNIAIYESLINVLLSK